MTIAFLLTIALATPAKPFDVVQVVRPQAVVTPSVPLTLVPAQTERGDALVLYLAAARAMPRLSVEEGREFLAAYELVETKPAREATPDELAMVRRVSGRTEAALRLTERAAQVRDCDWSPLNHSGPKAGLDRHAVNTAFRELTAVVQFRGFLSRAAGNHPKALDDARLLLCMAKHAGQGDYWYDFTHAASIETVALNGLREISSAGGPNLLLAVAELPRPLVPAVDKLRNGVLLLPGDYPSPEELQREVLSEAQLNELAGRFRRFSVRQPRRDPARKPDPKAFLEGKLTTYTSFAPSIPKVDFAALPDAAPVVERLAGLGVDRDRLKAMPKSQVYLLDAAYRVRAETDRRRMELALPPGHPLLVALPTPPPGPATAVAAELAADTAFDADTRDAERRQILQAKALLFGESLRAALAEPGAAWGPKLLDAPLVKAMTFDGAPNLVVTWDEANKAFAAPGVLNQRYVWKRAE